MFFFFCLNPHLPHQRGSRRKRVNRLGVILQLFGLGQDGVDIWYGVILRGTSVKKKHHCVTLHVYGLDVFLWFLKSLTCSDLIFTVKSPASKLSLMSLWTQQVNKKQSLTWRVRGVNAARRQQHSMKSSHEHGAADQDEEVESVLVRKQGVPDPDDVRQEELLR